MQVNWKCVAASARPDGRVVALVDFWRADEGLARREEMLLNPESPVPLDVQLKQGARERAQNVAAQVKPPQLDVLAALSGFEEV